MAKRLHLDTPGGFTFHSFRSSAATAAADAGPTSEQIIDFFCWSNSKMTTKCIRTSKATFINLANKLEQTEVIPWLQCNAVEMPNVSNQDVEEQPFHAIFAVEDVPVKEQKDIKTKMELHNNESEDMYMTNFGRIGTLTIIWIKRKKI